MSPGKSLLCLFAAGLALQSSIAVASDAEQRVFERSFFNQFAPQNALEMIERLPGFTLQQADEVRGLGQGGTNVLIDGQPVTGKGGTASNRIAQITADRVIRVEILDAGAIDIPGFSGLVANIVTRQTSIGGSLLWEPSFRRKADPAFGSGNVTISGSSGNIDYSGTFSHTMVRTVFDGPESLTDANGTIFEIRDEVFSISGDQPALSGSLTWKRPNGQVLNTKISYNQLNVEREQSTVNTALAPRGINGSSLAGLSAVQGNFRFDADYSLPALGGDLKLIGLARHGTNDLVSRLSFEDSVGSTLADQAFQEDSVSTEGVARIEQQWSGGENASWQLAGEGAYNALDLKTHFLVFDVANPDQITAQVSSVTKIEEARGEITLAHRRSLSSNSNLQLSLGGELSQIMQGNFQREFFRPKGFASYTIQPAKGLTLVGRIDRRVGQINFRDFAATVSLFDEVSTQDNVELVPQQSWQFSGRVERVFEAGHVASLNISHERISDLVDRIPVGENADAVGNIPSASLWGVEASVTLSGAAFGLPGAQLDLSGAWQWSSVADPIEDFTRDIGNLKLRDVSVRFRHDLPSTNLSYGFEFQDIKLAPVFRSTFVQFRNVPGGALTPGTNSIFVEHKDLFGLRARVQVSEFLGQKSRFRREIFAGRRDIAPLDRIESRERALNGPIFTLSFGRNF